MNNLLRKSLATAGAAACLLGVAATAQASPAKADEMIALGCREPVGAVETQGRWVHLWLCDDGWHGQITSAAAGDSIWLTSGAGTNYGHRTVAAGQTSANSATVGQFGGPWKACGRKAGYTPRCTASH